MKIGKLCPGGRILSGIGTDMPMTLIVLGPSENNDSVILLSEEALTRGPIMSPRRAGSYFYSGIDNYLETDFVRILPQPLRQSLVETQIRISKNLAQGEIVISNNRSVFLPSMYELGFGYASREGLSYEDGLKACFGVGNNQSARIAKPLGHYNSCRYWTRSLANDGKYYCVGSDGDSYAVGKAALISGCGPVFLCR